MLQKKLIELEQLAVMAAEMSSRAREFDLDVEQIRDNLKLLRARR